MPFQIHPLSKSEFEPFFAMSDDELTCLNARRMTATHTPGFPCRVSLEDAAPGEEVVLLNYEHLTGATPFRATHAVYVRRNAAQAVLAPNEVPAMLRSRILSLRAFDAESMLIAADLADGPELEAAIERMLENRSVAHIDLHFAKPGCFAARVTRS